MRVLAFLIALLAGAAAQAEINVFRVEHGQWMVYDYSGKVCRAVNRPAFDFNNSPFNVLQIVAGRELIAGRNNSIAVEVFFFPKAISPSRDYRLWLNFSPGSYSVTLEAKTTSWADMMLSASDDTGKLWAMFEKASSLAVAVEGAPDLHLSFGLDDIRWVLTTLQDCVRLLPKT